MLQPPRMYPVRTGSDRRVMCEARPRPRFRQRNPLLRPAATERHGDRVTLKPRLRKLGRGREALPEMGATTSAPLSAPWEEERVWKGAAFKKSSEDTRHRYSLSQNICFRSEFSCLHIRYRMTLKHSTDTKSNIAIIHSTIWLKL